ADCASLSESLLESELFGHVRGSFTGAVRDRKGLAEAARGGTLFLDEISTISPQIQGSLLRLIQEHEIRPVGADKIVTVDTRVIAATNKDLQELVRAGTYREDLFYRLSVFTIRIPPLRERPEEIPLLAHHFVQRFAKELDKPIDLITPQAMALLEAHDWPGNVRELENVIERAVLLADGRAIGPEAIPLQTENSVSHWLNVPADAKGLVDAKKELRSEAVEKLERLFVLKALNAAAWSVTAAARNVGMQRPNFHALMRKYGISVRDKTENLEEDEAVVPDLEN
ncbi:MAG TPA: sigma 54-interacting transcriptional regulator, partial [Longimicrobiales bacterium]